MDNWIPNRPNSARLNDDFVVLTAVLVAAVIRRNIDTGKDPKFFSKASELS